MPSLGRRFLGSANWRRKSPGRCFIESVAGAAFRRRNRPCPAGTSRSRRRGHCKAPGVVSLRRTVSCIGGPALPSRGRGGTPRFPAARWQRPEASAKWNKTEKRLTADDLTHMCNLRKRNKRIAKTKQDAHKDTEGRLVVPRGEGGKGNERGVRCAGTFGDRTWWWTGTGCTDVKLKCCTPETYRLTSLVTSTKLI